MTLALPLSTIYAFLLVLARVGGLFAFLPVPAFRNAPMIFRAVLAFVDHHRSVSGMAAAS